MNKKDLLILGLVVLVLCILLKSVGEKLSEYLVCQFTLLGGR